MIRLNYTKLQLVETEDTLEMKCLRVLKRQVDVVTYSTERTVRFTHLATVEYRGTAISISASLIKGDIKNIFIQHTLGDSIKSTFFAAKGEKLKHLSSLINTYIERSFGGK